MKQTYTAVLWREDSWYIAQCLEVDVASQGKSEDTALSNLDEALRLHFRDLVATVVPAVKRI